MSPVSQVGMLLINTVGSILLLIVMLRFLLQLVRADFYNPISQFIVKATNPVLIPLRRVIPGFGGLDIASLVLAYGVQVIFMAGALLVMGYGLPWANIVVWSLVAIFALIIKVYFCFINQIVVLSIFYTIFPCSDCFVIFINGFMK